MSDRWISTSGMLPVDWSCWHCGRLVAASFGYYRGHPNEQPDNIGKSHWRIVTCPKCSRPTFFEGEKQVPGVAYGKPVQHLPPDIDEIYTETRNCMSVGAYIPAVLAARTILMHVAVDDGAREGGTFAAYVDHLVARYAPTNSKGWIDHVRKQGNAATHRVALMTRDDAEKVLRFVELILMLRYEYPTEAASN